MSETPATPVPPNPPGPSDMGKERFEKAQQLLRLLMEKSPSTSMSLKMMHMGLQLFHYGNMRLSAGIPKEMRDNKTPDDMQDLVIAAADLVKAQVMKMAPYPPQMLKLMDECVIALRGDVKAEEKRIAYMQKMQLQIGIPTPFEGFNATRLSGGLKAGNVLVMYGEPEAIKITTAALFRFWNRRNVPFTFCNASPNKVEAVPGVKNVSISWWRDGVKTLGHAKDTFKVVEGPLVIVDRLDTLVGETAVGSGLATFVKTMKHYRKIAVVAKHSIDPLPQVQGVECVGVCKRLLNDKPVLMFGDEIWEEDENGGIRLHGRGDRAPEGVEGNPARGPEGAEQLQGSGENPGLPGSQG